MHRILLREVVIDAPPSTFAATRDFWAAALDADHETVEQYPEFTAMRRPAALGWVGLQQIESGEPRFHLDLETDDVEAEVDRLRRIGAREVERTRSWVVMQDPSGLLFCVVPYESPDFPTRSRRVG